MKNAECLIKTYTEELLKWNKKFNLTAITDPEEIKTKHFEDSLSILEVIDLKKECVVDIGAGAGFPGIPLKIARPEISLTMIEATQKKVNFLNHIIDILKLDKTEAIWSRAENLSDQYRESFDVAMSRAVARLNTLAEYCLPLVKRGGLFIAMKGSDVEDEVKEASSAIQVLGGKLERIVSLPKRSLILIRKSTFTPKAYPRGQGLAKKKPL